MNTRTVWIIKSTGHPKFPFRLTVFKGNEILLDLLTQDRWPGAKGNIFCLWAAGREGMISQEKEVESVPVLEYRTFGKRLTVILDRPIQKRCGFLFLTRGYKNREGEYEQIFWQTQQGLSARRTKYKLTYYKKDDLVVFVDSAERYAWNFPGAKIVKEKLSIGDYAVKDQFGILAVIERKTFANLMAELGNLKKFHQHLFELEKNKNSALVIEADYGDFLKPEKSKPYTGNFAARAIAEIQAVHPKLPVVFAGGRKAAIIFTQNLFETVSAKNLDFSGAVLREGAAKYGNSESAVSLEDELRRAVFFQMPESFTVRQLQEAIGCSDAVPVRRAVKKMEKEEILIQEGHGRAAVWRKIKN